MTIIINTDSSFEHLILDFNDEALEFACSRFLTRTAKEEMDSLIPSIALVSAQESK